MSGKESSKCTNRGKTPSPSRKNNPKKNSTSPKIKTKTETSNISTGSSSSTGPIDKYLIKKPKTVCSKNGDNNNVLESSKTKSDAKIPDADSKIKIEKDENNSEECVKEDGFDRKDDERNTKESSPESEIIVDDESDPDSGVVAKKSDSKHGLVVDDSLVLEQKETNGEKEPLKVCNKETKEQTEEKEKKRSKLESPATDDENNENGSKNETQDTEEYDIDATGNVHSFVDYKDEDFNTDTDFNNSDFEPESKEAEDSDKEKEEKVSGPSGSKRKTPMGGFFSRKRIVKQCQSSSSEEESERPWRQSGGSSHEQKLRDRRPYPLRSPRVPQPKRRWSNWDTQQYRDGYPDKPDNPHLTKNAEFYQGKIPSSPDGAYIDDFHKDWWHDHDRLESRHGYIQWLFPIRESGMNVRAQELQKHEAETIRRDPQAMRRFKKSYEMMLYFYGIKLLDKETGEVDRADNWQPRFRHLNNSTHNYLRITRILKCLGEMGLERFKVPLLQLLLREAASTRRLDRTLESCTNFWIGTVKDDDERDNLERLAKRLCRGNSSR